MRNTFKRFLSCLSVLMVCFMSHTGVEAKMFAAPQISNIIQTGETVQNNKKDFIRYDGAGLISSSSENELIAGHYSHRSHYSHSSHSSHHSHYSSRY